MSQIKFATLQEITTSSLSEFHRAARDLMRQFSPRSVVGLCGNLGAGKTEFVKAVAAALGVREISSPTFAIHHHYQSSSTSLDHLDLYRLENEDELETTGFWDFFSEPEGWILIEWPERMELSHIPVDWDLYLLEIQKMSGDSRKLTLRKRISN